MSNEFPSDLKSLEQERPDSSEGLEPKEQIKERLFSNYIFRELLNVFKKELEDQGFDKEKIIDFFSAVEAGEAQDGLEYINNLLAVPWELRKKWLKEAQQDGLGGSEVYQLLKSKYQKMEKFFKEGAPILGYHTSYHDIPVTEGEWNVKGTEISDLAEGRLAYAADNYRSLYRENGPRFLYIVRITEKEEKKYGGGDTSWYFSHNFPIVARIDLEEVDDFIKDSLKEELSSEAKGQDRTAA